MMPAVPPPNHLIPRVDAFAPERLGRIARRFGTPVFVYDAGLLASAWVELRDAIPAGSALYYSVKANPSVGVINRMAALGARFEIASTGELGAILRAGVDSHLAILVGPGKRDNAIRVALEQRVGTLVVESASEALRVERIAASVGVRASVWLRLNPGLPDRSRAGAPAALAMGGCTQFGMLPEEALSILQREAHPESVVEIVGVHAYLGTRILDYRTIAENTALILETAAALQRQSGRRLRFVDVGGGFGVPCYRGEEPLDLGELRRRLMETTGPYLEAHPWTESIAYESGRFLTARAGVLLCTVVDVKQRGDVHFVVLDGGIGSLGGRDAYIGARPMPVEVLGSSNTPARLTLCGPLCTPMDRVAANVLLPVPVEGDTVAFHLAGAYSLTASAGRFLSHGFAAEVMVDGEADILVGEREDALGMFFSQSRGRGQA